MGRRIYHACHDDMFAPFDYTLCRPRRRATYQGGTAHVVDDIDQVTCKRCLKTLTTLTRQELCTHKMPGTVSFHSAADRKGNCMYCRKYIWEVQGDVRF